MARELADSMAASGFDLQKYLKAVLEGTLLLENDCRRLSVNGRAYELQVRGLEEGVWLVVEATQLRVSLKEEPEEVVAGETHRNR